MLAHGDSRSQEPDRAIAGAAGRLLFLGAVRRHAVRRQGARAARSRALVSAARRASARAIDALLPRRHRARGHRHRLGRRGARAREPADQAAQSALQRPAARRQDLSVPAADDDRAGAAAAGGPAGRARRQRVRGPVHAGVGRAPDDERWRTGCSASGRATRSSTASATGPASSTTSSAASRRAWPSICSLERVPPRGRAGAAADRRPAGRAGRRACTDEMARPRPSRAVRARRAPARRDQDDRDARGVAQQDGGAGDGRSRRLRPQSRAVRRRRAGVSDAPRPHCRSHRAGHRSRRDRWPAIRTTATLLVHRAAAVLRRPRWRRRRSTRRSSSPPTKREAIEAWLSATRRPPRPAA